MINLGIMGIHCLPRCKAIDNVKRMGKVYDMVGHQCKPAKEILFIAAVFRHIYAFPKQSFIKRYVMKMQFEKVTARTSHSAKSSRSANKIDLNETCLKMQREIREKLTFIFPHFIFHLACSTVTVISSY